jgi:molecular chaperone GrpE
MTQEDERQQPPSRPRVKVTDKRRVHTEDPAASAPEAPQTAAEESTGELERAKAQATEYLSDLQRLKAEFENYRKRVLKEQTRAVELASEPLIGRLLEVVDEFELALTAAEQFDQSHRFVQGVEMVYAKLMEILRSTGLEKIEAEGAPFDPSRHEALLQADGGDGEAYVADVLRTGYTLKGRVVRPAGVKVARR